MTHRSWKWTFDRACACDGADATPYCWHMRFRALIVAALLLGLAALPAGAKARHGLRAFQSCAQLLGYARAHGTAAVKTGWVPTPFSQGSPTPGRVPTSKGGPIAPQAAGAQDSSSAGAGETFSTTNVQEQGVDEPDVVKTDGKVMFAVANGVLHAVDVSGDEPRLLATLTLDPGYG